MTATAPISGQLTPASAQASSRTGTIQRRWARAATSGTIPPDGAWSATCEATTLERISRPSSMTAIPVSSQDDSIDSTSEPLTRGHRPHAGSDRGSTGAGAASTAARSRAIRSRIAGSRSWSVVMIRASSPLSL